MSYLVYQRVMIFVGHRFNLMSQGHINIFFLCYFYVSANKFLCVLWNFSSVLMFHYRVLCFGVLLVSIVCVVDKCSCQPYVPFIACRIYMWLFIWSKTQQPIVLLICYQWFICRTWIGVFSIYFSVGYYSIPMEWLILCFLCLLTNVSSWLV